MPGATPALTESFGMTGSETLVPLELILCTEELNRRPTRAPDYATEIRALLALAQALVDSPRTILQALSDTVLTLLNADSAGLSLLTPDETQFHWPSVSGMWSPHAGGGILRDSSPCGDVLAADAPLLFRRFERRYPHLMQATPLAEECLLAPFYVAGKAVGTIWAIAHDARRQFDSEDLRQLESLGKFASAAYQATEALNNEKEFNRSIIDSSPDCIKVLDLDARLLSIYNCYRLLGIEDAQPYLNTSLDRLLARSRPRGSACGSRSGQGGRRRQFRRLFPHPAGRTQVVGRLDRPHPEFKRPARAPARGVARCDRTPASRNEPRISGHDQSGPRAVGRHRRDDEGHRRPTGCTFRAVSVCVGRGRRSGR